MDTNGESTAADVTLLPEDPTALLSTLQRQADDVGQPFAAVDADHRKYYDGDMAQLDALESQTLAAISRLRQELRPEFVQPKIQALAEEALKRLEPFETNRLSRLEGELQRLQREIPQEAVRSELAENTQTVRDLYVLSQIGAEVLGDPLQLRLAYLQAVEQRNIHVMLALERDPMDRSRQCLTDEDRRRGRIARGLSASPDLQRKIDGYETIIARYRSRFRQLQRHLAAEGWQALDPLVLQASPAPRD
jgi:hypothetical protein